nr:PLP-dependent transferase [Fastidiosibacter lacustris]
MEKKSLDKMLNRLKIFGLGHSWGGHESLLVPVESPQSYRLPNSWDRSGWLMRVSLGFEDIEDLKNDLSQAFTELK